MQSISQNRRIVITIAFVPLALAFYILYFTRVPHPTPENSYVISGRVTKVESGGANDVVLTLVDRNRIYYINRGLKHGVKLDQLIEQLEGKHAEFHVIRRMWSPLDPLHRAAPIARVTLGDKVLFPLM